MDKALDFVGSSREDLQAFPKRVRWLIGHQLFKVQAGEKPEHAKPLQGFGGAGVLELIAYFDRATYRGVYTVKFEKSVYVLHCFQKKSKRGIETPQQDIELIKRRFKEAEEAYEAAYGQS